MRHLNNFFIQKLMNSLKSKLFFFKHSINIVEDTVSKFETT